MFASTKHAEIRAQQRGIPPAVIELLLSYGTSHHDRHRGMVLYFDSRSRKRLQRAVDERALAHYSGQLDCYAVLSTDGSVITVGHRTRRFRLDPSRRVRVHRRH